MSTGGTIRYSILIPIYNEEDSVTELCDRLASTLADARPGAPYEILFVNDGSNDQTADRVNALAAERSYVRVIHLRRNMGKSMALMTGFKMVRGECVVQLDGDLQDRPEDIPALLDAIEINGYDLVNGWRQNRQDSRTRKLGSRLFNRSVYSVTGLYLHDFNCGLKAYRREVVELLCVYGQYHRYIPLQAHQLGFRIGEVPVTNDKRKFGFSKYRTFRYQGAFDLLSLLFIQRYGLNPLHFFGALSVLIILPSLALLLYFAGLQTLFLLGFGDEYMVHNRPLLLASLFSLLLGMLIFLTGFVCDFVLYHVIRNRIDEIVDVHVVRQSNADASATQTTEKKVAGSL